MSVRARFFWGFPLGHRHLEGPCDFKRERIAHPSLRLGSGRESANSSLSKSSTVPGPLKAQRRQCIGLLLKKQYG